MDIVVGILSALFESSVELAIFFGLIAASIVFLWFQKKMNMDSLNNLNKNQSEQIDSLVKQLEYVSAELTKARIQLSEIHDQNTRLMTQVRDYSRKITTLEQSIIEMEKMHGYRTQSRDFD